MTSAMEIIHDNDIGASEIAAILGLSPFLGPLDVYGIKKGRIKMKPSAEKEWGKILQPVVAEQFAKRMGVRVEFWDKPIYSSERAWQRASPDYFVLDQHPQPERKAVLECKTAGLYQAKSWDRNATNEDGVPEDYVAQVQWQMTVTGMKLAFIAVLIGGSDFRIYRIEHDPVLEEILNEEGERFVFQHLYANVEPPLEGARHVREYLQARFPRDREKLRPAKPEEAAWLEEYTALRGELEVLESRKDQLESQIKLAIGDAEGLNWPRGKFTWKRARDGSEINWEALARDQIEGYTEQQKKDLIEQHTRVVHGSRRIHLRLEEKFNVSF